MTSRGVRIGTLQTTFVHQLLLIVGLIGFVLIVVHFARRSPLPYPAVMAVVGLAIGLTPGVPHIHLNPDLVLYVLLPPLLYYAAWYTSWPEFRRNGRAVSMLAFGLVFVTTAAVAIISKLLVPGMSWPVAFVLGAILSPPDAIAATVVCRKAAVSPRLLAVLEGESLLNDAGALVAFRVALAAVVTGTFSPSHAAWGLVVAALGGVFTGLIIGKIASFLHGSVNGDAFTSLCVSILVPYFTFILAELIHASGVLAVVTAGVLVSRESPKIFCPASRVVGLAVWTTFTLFLNAFAFTLVGLQVNVLTGEGLDLPIAEVSTMCVAVFIAVVLVRFLFVVATARIATGSGVFDRESEWTFRHHLVVAWTGMRGVVSLAAVLSLPMLTAAGDPFPFRQLLVTVTFFVVLATLVIQSLLLPALIAWLGLSAREETERQKEVARDALTAAGSLPYCDPAKGTCYITSNLSSEQIVDCRAAILSLRASGGIGEDIFREFEYLLDIRELSLSEVAFAVA